MGILLWLGAGVYATGHGVTKVPNGGLVGAIAMIVGGVLIIMGAIVRV